jgi:hypothetical protein
MSIVASHNTRTHHIPGTYIVTHSCSFTCQKQGKFAIILVEPPLLPRSDQRRQIGGKHLKQPLIDEATLLRAPNPIPKNVRRRM